MCIRDRGEVDFVDDIGTIHMRWDNGRALGIVPGEDSFTVLDVYKRQAPTGARIPSRSC